jgi:hypothetical protein
MGPLSYMRHVTVLTLQAYGLWPVIPITDCYSTKYCVATN